MRNLIDYIKHDEKDSSFSSCDHLNESLTVKDYKENDGDYELYDKDTNILVSVYPYINLSNELKYYTLSIISPYDYNKNKYKGDELLKEKYKPNELNKALDDGIKYVNDDKKKAKFDIKDYKKVNDTVHLASSYVKDDSYYLFNPKTGLISIIGREKGQYTNYVMLIINKKADRLVTSRDYGVSKEDAMREGIKRIR